MYNVSSISLRATAINNFYARGHGSETYF